MRIIGGESRGRKLKTLEGSATRPTLDRVKEAVFNMVGPWINDAVVLDLFAGSGGLAFEALSRGAKKAYINDISKSSVKVIKENADTLGYGENVEIFNLSWQDMLKKTLQKGVNFDIIILDPPYANDYIYECVNECKRFLSEGGVIIIEHDENTAFQDDVIKEKKYGIVRITFVGEKNE